MSIEDARARAQAGESFVVEGMPGTGKTTLLKTLFENAASRADNSKIAPPMVLLPDRHRAARFEDTLTARVLEATHHPGGHRLVRGVNSYAYLVLSQWLVEREYPLPRPKLTGGADEDLWVSAWLADHPGSWQELFPAEAAASETFRMEVRNALARLGEREVSPSDLESIASRSGSGVWTFLSTLYAHYAGPDEIAFTESTPHVDAAKLQIIAANILGRWHERAGTEGVIGRPPIPDLLLVDDLQDCTPATWRLLKAAYRSGSQLIACSSPLSTTAAFRGADSELGAQVAAALELPTLELVKQFRSSAPVTQVVNAAGRWIQPEIDLPPGTGTDAAGAARAVIVSGAGKRGAWLAQKIRWHHYLEEIPWHSQAVIVRSAADIEPIRRQLLRAEIPLAPGERPLQLASNRATATLLELLAPQGEAPAEESVMRLLESPFVNVDRLELYRYLRQFGEEQLTYEEQLLKWLQQSPGTDGQNLSAREQRLVSKMQRASRMWRAREEAAKQSAQTGLWMLWEAADVADLWRRRALLGGVEGDRADARLDAIMALFRRADFWEQQGVAQHTQALSARDFAEEMLEQTVAADSVAEVGLREAGVEVLTVSQAAGREWDVVYLTGLQDGLWPARARASSLIDLPRLEQVLRLTGHDEASGAALGRIDRADPFVYRADLDERAYRLRKRQEEARLLISAASRAKTSLYLVAVENDDEAASPFLNYLAKQSAIPSFRDEDGKAVQDEVPPPLDLGSMIGQLRRASVDPLVPEEGQKQAAALLAIMADAGAQAADPSTWAGAGGVTTDSPLLTASKLQLSPSRLQSAKDCSLQWFFQAIHGEDKEGILRPALISPALTGQLVHSVAEAHPHGNVEELRAELSGQWEALGLDNEKWWVRRQRAELEEMMSILAQHFQAFTGQVEVEVPLRAELDNVVIYGRADRVETLDDGTARIVDIKTGTNLPAVKAVPDNLQLAAYQMGLQTTQRPGGAALLAVTKATYKSSFMVQPALDEQRSADLKQELNELGKELLGPTYAVSPISACRTCKFQAICPIQDKGVRSVP